MKKPIIATAAFLLTIILPATAQAANNDDLRQLLAKKKCENCSLSNAGLAMADLRGADLRGADLSGANLSGARLSGADLTGANLSGASLFGANLTNAKLDSANLMGADLRTSYLMNVNLNNANLTAANFQGAIGIPLQIAKPEEFYSWGVAAAEKGNLDPAIDYFNQAIALKSDYAGAYLARGVASYQKLDRKSALADAQIAAKLFESQKNTEGLQTTQAFILELTTPQTEVIDKGKPNFMNFVGSLGSILLQFLPF
ncbi:MAG: hypothetical protein EAZ76_16440 [Nostocales cyanobacterium]|nr:MAG: hypothetical protein EAZ87_16865 [Nostocales cyanobacterium]TAF09241.1 MAG: hypothetical protein EAZ76_16440 [Nostocales cyanobacterium]